jgi:hypothetical protein
MTDEEFLAYCSLHAITPRCGFTPEQLNRLCRLAGRDEEADYWSTQPNQIVNCREHVIHGLVEMAEERLS